MKPVQPGNPVNCSATPLGEQGDILMNLLSISKENMMQGGSEAARRSSGERRLCGWKC